MESYVVELHPQIMYNNWLAGCSVRVSSGSGEDLSPDLMLELSGGWWVPYNRPPLAHSQTRVSYPVPVMQGSATSTTSSHTNSTVRDRATSTTSTTTYSHNTSTEENSPPCHLGTPVCLPAVVWYEDTGGKKAPCRAAITSDGF